MHSEASLARAGFVTLVVLYGVFVTVTRAHAATPGSFAINAVDTLASAPENVSPFSAEGGFLVADVDRDGASEVILPGDGESVVRVLKYDAIARAYFIAGAPRLSIALSPSFAHSSVPRAVGPARPNGTDKLFVALPGRGIARYDLASLQLESLSAPAGGPGPANDTDGLRVVRDVDGDGTNELIFIQRGVAVLYDYELRRELAFHQTASFESASTGTNAGAIIGAFSAPDSVEVMDASGQVNRLSIDAYSRVGSIGETVDGERISDLAAADVDGDGREEIIASHGTGLRVIDFDTGRVKWSHNYELPIASPPKLATCDANGDGRPDVVYGQSGDPARSAVVSVLDGASGAIIARFLHGATRLNAILCADFDGDRRAEIFVLNAAPVTGPFLMAVHDAATGALEWRSNGEQGLVRALGAIDTDSDGVDELVWSPLDVPLTYDLALRARTANSFQPAWRHAINVLPVMGTYDVRGLAGGDLDGDGDRDIVVSAYGRDQRGIAWVLDGPTRRVLRGVDLGQFNAGGAVAVGDVTGDGRADIVIGTRAIASSSAGPFVRIYDGATGSIVWSSDGLNLPFYGVYSIRLGDLNRDGRLDIVAATRPDAAFSPAPEIFAIDGVNRSLRRIALPGATGIELQDVVGDAAPEIVVGREDGAILLVDAASGEVRSTRQVCPANEPVNGVSRNRLPNAGADEVLFTCATQVGWAALNSGVSRLLSAPLGIRVGLNADVLSGGSSPDSAWIATTSASSVVYLRPVVAVPPFVMPFRQVQPGNITTGVSFTKHWRDPITFFVIGGSFVGETPEFEIVEPPAVGRLSASSFSPGGFTFENGPFQGSAMLTFRARAGGNVSVPTRANMIVTNAAPRFTVRGTLEATAGIESIVPVSFQDSDGDPLEIEVVTAPARGTVRIDENRVVYYTPRVDASGSDSITVRAFDQVSRSAPAVVSVTVAAVPAPAPPPAAPQPGPTPSPTPAGSSGGGGLLEGWLLLVLAIAAVARQAVPPPAPPSKRP